MENQNDETKQEHTRMEREVSANDATRKAEATQAMCVATDAQDRLGVAKGKFFVPDDIDGHNDEYLSDFSDGK